MAHLPDLIQDLAIILIAAGLAAVVFKRLKQPVVLGYIIAGLCVGPNISIFPTVTDIQSIRVWAEIGVIFLLFALGLEFSFKKLARVGGAASITAFVEVIAMVLLGFLTGRLFGWNNMDSLFLGGVLAISSTTIIIRAFDELGVKSRGFVGLVFGVLIVEDLFAILLMVLLVTVAATKTFSGAEMMISVLKLGFFLTLWFVGGVFLLPTLLRMAKRFMNQETLLIVSIGLCFLMVVVATKAGFSPALGAFVMGSILAETTEAEAIEHLILPVKDLFAAIFFVSVGMLIDPTMLWEHKFSVLVITLVTIFGKTLSTLLGALLAGQSLRHSLQSGLSLAQIGEFSFIIAGLGLSLNVTSDFLYPIAVGVSAATTFTTPYMIKSADHLYSVVSARLPGTWKEGLERYSISVKSISFSNEWQQVLRSSLSKVVVNGILFASVFLSVKRFVFPVLKPTVENARVLNVLGVVISLMLGAPFLWGMIMSGARSKIKTSLLKLDQVRVPLFALEVSRLVLAIVLTCVLSAQFVSLRTAVILAFGLVGVFLLVFSRYLEQIYNWLLSRFEENLSEKQNASSAAHSLAPWDAHLARIDIPAEANFLGKTLEELKVRESYGVTVALIERGKRKITAPNRIERLYPGDRVSVLGTDEQIARLKQAVLAASQDGEDETDALRYSLCPIQVQATSSFCGQTIRDSGIRERSKGLVVGIEREGKRILNPDSMMTIQPGDLLWIVADPVRAQGLN